MEVTYEPFVNALEGTAGFRATRSDGSVEYIYMLPSYEDHDDPNVFVYQGTEGTPHQDGAAHHYLLFEQDDDQESNCVVCGSPMSFCQGHGEIGDPVGHNIQVLHDRDIHSGCHPDGCDQAER